MGYESLSGNNTYPHRDIYPIMTYPDGDKYPDNDHISIRICIPMDGYTGRSGYLSPSGYVIMG